MAYLCLNPIHYQNLIPNEAQKKHDQETGEFFRAIPQAEVWIADEVPLSWIDKVVIAECPRIPG